MRWLLAVALAVAAASCARCGARGERDAGAPARAPAAAERKSVDLRTVVIQLFPEYRDVAVLSSRAHVSRVIPGLTDAARDAALTRLGWRRVEDGGPGWALNRFQLEQLAADTLDVSLTLDTEALGLLYVAPSSLSSMELAHYLPRDLPVGRETFEFELHHVTSPERAVVRVRQAATLLLNNGQWRLRSAPPGWDAADAGEAALPDAFTVELEHLEGARVSWARTRGQTLARYRWVTVGR